MNFYDEIKKNGTEILIVGEFDIPLLLKAQYLYNIEPGIWRFNLSPGVNQKYIDPYGKELILEYENNIHYDRIESVKIDDEQQNKVYSILELKKQNRSFFYDSLSGEIIFHFNEFNWPMNSIVRVGLTMTFLNRPGKKSRGKLGKGDSEILHEIRLQNIPQINNSIDSLFFGIQTFQGSNPDIINIDGTYDNIDDKLILGQEFRYSIICDGMKFDDAIRISTGYVESVTISRQSLKLSVQDPRKFLTRKIPINSFSKIDYPYINDEYMDKPKPILSGGPFTGIKTICLNELEPDATVYTFFVIDTEYHVFKEINQICKIVDDIRYPLTPVSLDLNKGLFQLNKSDCFDDDNLLKIVVDATADNSNHLDMIASILQQYGDKNFNDMNYNLTEWEKCRQLSCDAAYYIDTRITIQEFIENVCKSFFGVLQIQADSKITMKRRGVVSDPVKVIYDYEWKSDPVKSRDYEEFLTSCTIEYSQDYTTKEYLECENKDHEREALKQGAIYKEKSFPTKIVNYEDAKKETEFLMNYAKKLPPVVKRTTGLQHIDLKVYDLVICNHERWGKDPKWKVYLITGYKVMLEKKEIEFTMEYQKDYPGYNRNWAFFGSVIVGESLVAPNNLRV